MFYQIEEKCQQLYDNTKVTNYVNYSLFIYHFCPYFALEFKLYFNKKFLTSSTLSLTNSGMFFWFNWP